MRVSVSVRQGKLSRQEQANALSHTHIWTPLSSTSPAPCWPFSETLGCSLMLKTRPGELHSCISISLTKS